MAEKIFFYGDSNTWGYQPGGGRLAFQDRFSTIVAACLKNVQVVEEGLNGRNASADQNLSLPELLGGATFEALFSRALPCAALVIMLGTNDIFPPINHTASELVVDLEDHSHGQTP